MNFIDPKTTVQQMGLKSGMKVADFGAGSGHYTFAASSWSVVKGVLCN